MPEVQSEFKASLDSPALGRLRQADHGGFEVNLGYIMCSRTAWGYGVRICAKQMNHQSKFVWMHVV